MLEMKDTETGVTMVLQVQDKPQNPRTGENNIFRIVTWSRLGDPHEFRDRAHFHRAIRTRDNLIYRLKTIGEAKRPTLQILRDTDTPCAGYAFASYDLLRLELKLKNGAEIGAAEVAKAEEMLLVELLTYEEYVQGHVYAFQVYNAAGVLLEERQSIYGADYAEHLATTAFEDQRLSIIAGDG